MSRVADSSFLMALFDRNDPRRQEAIQAVQDPEPILVPPLVLSETLGVVQVRKHFETSQAIWEDLGDPENLVFLDTTRAERIAPIFLNAEGDLSWVDAAVVAHCELEDAEPLCYDEAIEAACQA